MIFSSAATRSSVPAPENMSNLSML